MLNLAVLATLIGSAIAADEANPLVPELEQTNYVKHDVDEAGMHYKAGKGLVIASDDGLFSMAIGLRGMFLYQLDNDPNASAPDPVSTQSIMIRRARVTFAGHMWHPKNKYKIELAMSPKDMKTNDDGLLAQTPLLTWKNTFAQNREFELSIGQYKIPFSRERVVSSSKLAMVDRSAVNKAFNLDRDIGMDVGSTDVGGAGVFQYNLGIYAGEGRGRFESSDFGMMYLGRVNFTPMGTFDDYEPQDFKRTSARLSVGMAYAYVDGAQGAKSILDGGPANATYNYNNATVDALFKVRGFSTMAAFHWRDGGDVQRQFAEVGSGYYVEPAYLLPGLPVGITGRWDQVLPAEGTAMSAKTEVGPGLSYYMNGARNKMKVQADFLRSWGDDPSQGKNLARLQLQAML